MAKEQVVSPETEEAPVEQEMSGKDQAYLGGLMKLLHGKETSGSIVGMLKSAPAQQSVPQAALTIFDQYDSEISKKSGNETSLETKLMGGIYLVQDLMEIGNASGAWEQDVTEEDMPALLQGTLKPYIHRGLKDGSIDPVELQGALEPLMDDEQVNLGLQGAEATGVPLVAGQQAAMEQYASQRERKAVNRAANKQAAQNRSGMLQGGA